MGRCLRSFLFRRVLPGEAAAAGFGGRAPAACAPAAGFGGGASRHGQAPLARRRPALAQGP